MSAKLAIIAFVAALICFVWGTWPISRWPRSRGPVIRRNGQFRDR